jgi:predicted TIM-barrel fold metal-dependent hydrolase
MGNDYKIIDVHVHTAGPGDFYENDLYWHNRFEKGIGYQGVKFLKGWGCKKVGDELMRKVLVKQADNMKKVDYAVVLAFDDVYEVDGTYRGSKQVGVNEDDIYSTLYVSNDYARELSRSNSKLLFGLSVHPFRDDAIDKLDMYHEEAVLCKWLPSAQMIDLSDDNAAAQAKLIPFYEKLKEIKLPLLIHTGKETGVPSAIDGYEIYNSPKYSRKALDAGVTVILAHCGCSYIDYIMGNFVDEVIALFDENNPDWDLYADISALFSPCRKGKILNDIFTNIPTEKLIYGSDFPNPAKGRKESLMRALLKFKKTNLLNRYYRITKKTLNKHFSNNDAEIIFTNFHGLLERLGRGHLIS